MSQSKRNKRKSQHNSGQHGYHGRKPEKHHAIVQINCEGCFAPIFKEERFTKKREGRLCARCSHNSGDIGHARPEETRQDLA